MEVDMFCTGFTKEKKEVVVEVEFAMKVDSEAVQGNVNVQWRREGERKKSARFF